MQAVNFNAPGQVVIAGEKAAVARAIEQSGLARLDDRAALLAHHWEEAGEAINAARWHQHAAESPGCANFSGAIRHWQRVRVLLRERPFDHESAGLSITACTRLLNLRQRIGIELDDARALFDEGKALALQLGDRRAELNLLVGYARTLWGAGDVSGYLEMARQNQRAALAMDDLALQTSAWGAQFHALCLTAQFPAATAMVEAVAKAAREVRLLTRGGYAEDSRRSRRCPMHSPRRVRCE